MITWDWSAFVLSALATLTALLPVEITVIALVLSVRISVRRAAAFSEILPPDLTGEEKDAMKAYVRRLIDAELKAYRMRKLAGVD